MSKILIATDAWKPQINGVVRTLSYTIEELTSSGHEVRVISPNDFTTFPCPVYPEIALSLPKPGFIKKTINEFSPDHIHIVAEGPIGLQTRYVCRSLKLNFTTAFHTKFPDYAKKLAFIPLGISWSYLRWFHKHSGAVMTPTDSIIEELKAKRIINAKKWSRGINLELFKPRPKTIPQSERPLQMYIGRISKEKNVEAFLNTNIPGTKYLVGDGPLRKRLEQKYPEAKFLGYKTGEELAKAYSEADVFVFPSLTDTFGNVVLEALASGVPVAAYPAPGPKDTIIDKRYGSCNKDLNTAISEALENADPLECVKYANTFTWKNATDQFLSHLVPVMT